MWEQTGEIPDDVELKDQLKTHTKYKGLHSQSSQRVLEELAEAFNSWYKKRKSDKRANPPGFFSRALAPVRMVRETSGLTLPSTGEGWVSPSAVGWGNSHFASGILN